MIIHDNIMFLNRKKFIVCPNCGFGNIIFVEYCKNCNFSSFKQLKNTNRNLNLPINLDEEKSQYDKIISNNYPPIPIVKGINLSLEEYILLFVRCSFFKLNSIIKNRDRFQKDSEGYRCSYNCIVFTNDRILFISKSLLGGWRKIESLSYIDIQDYKIEKRKHYSPILDENDRMMIKTKSDDVFKLTGFNPKRQFLAISKCIQTRIKRRTKGSGLPT